MIFSNSVCVVSIIRWNVERGGGRHEADITPDGWLGRPIHAPHAANERSYVFCVATKGIL
jgi:hypothetical protein